MYQLNFLSLHIEMDIHRRWVDQKLAKSHTLMKVSFEDSEASKTNRKTNEVKRTNEKRNCQSQGQQW